MRIHQGTKVRIDTTHLVEYLFMISIIVGCRSVFVQARPYFGYAIIIITTILSIFSVARRKGSQLSRRAASILITYLIMAAIVTLLVGNTEHRRFIICYWILVPLMLLYFLLLTYQEKMDWLEHFSDVVFVFIVLSTISWLIGPNLHLIGSTHVIQIYWGGNATYHGYLLCYVRPYAAVKNYMGISFIANTSIFVEAPITNVIYASGYVLNAFVKRDKSKVKEAIYIFAMFTTLSMTSILLVIAIFAIKRMLSYRENPSNNSFQFFMERYILPVVLFAVACFGINYMMGIKASYDASNFHAHTYALTSGFQAWLTKPITGYGYELGQQFYNTTSGFFRILVHGGVVFALFYIIPFLATLNFARKKKDFGLASFAAITFVLLIAVIWHYSLTYMFVLAFELSFMTYEYDECTVEGDSYYYDTIETGSQKIYRG